jgi:hypothetical protein
VGEVIKEVGRRKRKKLRRWEGEKEGSWEDRRLGSEKEKVGR